jgi:hypothetical protein
VTRRPASAEPASTVGAEVVREREMANLAEMRNLDVLYRVVCKDGALTDPRDRLQAMTHKRRAHKYAEAVPYLEPRTSYGELRDSG